MERATISQLKNNLSAYLRKVRAGETVLVLDRNRPVARIEAVSGPDFEDERLAELERQGLIRRPTHPLTPEEWDAFLKEPLPKAKASVLEALLEERREER